MDERKFGFLTIAIGHDRYLKQAEILSLSLRRNMPGVPLAIVTDSERLRTRADIIIRPKDAKVGVLHKLFLGDYSPFDETLFIDSDCIATRPFHEELEDIRRFEFTPAMERFTLIDGVDEYIDDLGGTLTRIGATSFAKFNGGVYFFRKSDAASSVFELAQAFHRDYRDYGIKAFDRSGPGEETVIGLALAKLGMTELYFDSGRLMRTPTGLKGNIVIDPLGGGCTFERYDGIVTPAICHFAGPYLLTSAYRLAAYSLEHNVRIDEIGMPTRLTAQLNSRVDQIVKFLGYKVHGLKKRLRPI